MFNPSFRNRGDMLFHTVIEKDENGLFSIECPALPGCVSQGKTKQEAIENIKDAMQKWLWAEDSKKARPYIEQGKTTMLVSLS